jgi:hypothetical protein
MISKKSSWIDVKRSIGRLERNQLVDLVKDLYRLSEENKTFLHARCLAGSDALKRYKKTIRNSIYTDVMDEDDNQGFDLADKAVKDYAKATGDDSGIADLMIYYVECGNKLTLEYGDINEFFYDALVEMYQKAIQKVCNLPKTRQEPFRIRLKKIMTSSDGIGWGYHDDLRHFYYEAFE